MRTFAMTALCILAVIAALGLGLGTWLTSKLIADAYHHDISSADFYGASFFVAIPILVGVTALAGCGTISALLREPK